MHASKQLRRLLDRREFISAPGAYDPLTARLVEAAGFPAVYMSGYATAASWGVADNGTLGREEMRYNAARIARAVSVPVIADADTGYDDPAGTVREYEAAGVAAIQLEDQVWPKKCGHMEGKQLVSIDEMRARLRDAAGARSAGMVIIARTDAIAVEGFDAAIERARQYADAGADVLFVEAPESLDQLERIPDLLPERPHLYNAAPKTPSLSTAELQRLGYAVAIYPGLAFTANMLATRAALDNLRETGEQANLDDWRQHFPEWNRFLGERA